MRQEDWLTHRHEDYRPNRLLLRSSWLFGEIDRSFPGFAWISADFFEGFRFEVLSSIVVWAISSWGSAGRL